MSAIVHLISLSYFVLLCSYSQLNPHHRPRHRQRRAPTSRGKDSGKTAEIAKTCERKCFYFFFFFDWVRG
jgi:hypothetical protein